MLHGKPAHKAPAPVINGMLTYLGAPTLGKRRTLLIAEELSSLAVSATAQDPTINNRPIIGVLTLVGG